MIKLSIRLVINIQFNNKFKYSNNNYPNNKLDRFKIINKYNKRNHNFNSNQIITNKHKIICKNGKQRMIFKWNKIYFDVYIANNQMRKIDRYKVFSILKQIDIQLVVLAKMAVFIYFL